MFRKSKIWTVLVIALILLGLLAGCTAASTTGTTKATTAGSGTAAATTAAATTAKPAAPTVLVWAQVDEGYSTMLKNPETVAVHDEIQKQLNIDLKPVFLPLDQYDNRVSILLGSGDQIDILPRLTMVKAIKYFTDGVIIDLTQLLAKAPNIEKVCSTDAMFGQARKESKFNGKDILIPSSIGFLRGDAFMIRPDWLKKLNLSVPKTLEDFVAYMEAVKTKDPDGNGANDSFGLSLSVWGAKFETYLADYYLPSGNAWWLDASGQLLPPEMHPNYKLMLTDLVAWAKAGYLPPQVLTAKDDQRLDWITSNKVGALAGWYSSAIGGTITLQGKVPDADFQPINLTGKPGAANAYQNQRAMANSNGITASCKNPEAALKFFDFMFTKAGEILTLYGIEGKSFNIVNNMPDSILAADKTKLYYAAYHPQTGGPAPFGLFAGVAPALVLYRKQITATTALPGFDAPDKLVNYDVSTFASKDKQTDLTTYIDEQRLKVLAGETPVSEWDNIIAKWRQMGEDTLIADKNKQYKASKS